MKQEILFYISVFFRRIHLFLTASIAALAVSITLASVLPPVYLSGTTLLLETSQIPTALAAPTVNTGALEELQIVEQRLMTRNNLLNIARDLNVFEDMDEMTTDQIVAGMRRATKIRRRTGGTQANLLTITFEADRGPVTANVLNRYVTIVLQENAKTRAGRAGDTLEFFETEVERLDLELEEKSAEIVKFQNKNAGALPSTLTFRLSQQSILQQRLTTVERDISLLTEQRRRLVEVFEATGSVGPNLAVQLTPEQKALATLQDDLRRALAIYSTENPKVKLIKAQIKQQEIVVAAQGSANPKAGNGALTVLDVNLADIDARLDLLQEERQQITDQLAALVASIDKTAEIDVILTALNRDYANIQGQYDRTVGRQSEAAAAERIELLSKGRRITVLTPANVPQAPTGPNKSRIVAVGTLIGAAAGLGLIVLLEMLDNSLRRSTDIVRHLGVSPLVTVPYMRTPMELVARRATVLLVVMGILVGIPVALLAVHTYYLPLDLLYEKVAGIITNVI